MENHIHLILHGEDLSESIRRFKSYTARKIIDFLKMNNRRRYLDMLTWAKKKHKRDARYQLWTHGYHPVELDSDAKILNALDYIHNNPVERGYVDRPEDWRYSSARNYSLRPDLLIDVTLFGSG